MLFTQKFKAGIRAGQITRTYRTWKKPQAKVGGRYNLHPDGIIEVTSMSLVAPARITDQDAAAAGFDDADALRRFLKNPAKVHLVEFAYLGAGLVGQPDRERLSSGELQALIARLEKMDARSEGPWTIQVLKAIAAQPGCRAGDLAPDFGWDTPTFKRQVRKLKGLGLTLSLETGYELAPRGVQVVELRG